MIRDNKANFPYKLLLTDRQVSSLRKSFATDQHQPILSYQRPNY